MGKKPQRCVPPISYKACTKCKKEYPATLEFFYKDSRVKCGTTARCKTCLISVTTEYKKKNPWADRLVGIKQRCENSNSKDYKNYGGRGIKCKFTCWQELEAALGPRPSKKHSIERPNTNGDYEPGNVKWANAKEQGRNTRANKLSEKDIPYIKKLVSQGLTYKFVGSLYGVDDSTVCRIFKGKVWV